MSSTMRMWIEIIFSVGYLVIIWVLVSKMFRRIENVIPNNIPVARSVMLAFTLLALGDTGHVGFRVLAFYLGGLETKLNLFGGEISLVGSGALTAAVTITFFYVSMLDAWRKRFNTTYGVFEYILIIAAIVRLIIFIHPENQWYSVVPPFGWSIARNIPLMIQSLGVAYLVLRDGIKRKDDMFKLIGIMILVSYFCYLPIIFFIQKIYWVGMLMIPKTLAYIAMAVIAYRELYKDNLNTIINSSHISKGI